MPVKEYFFTQHEDTPYFVEDTTGLPKFLHLEITATADPEDQVTVFTSKNGEDDNMFEVSFKWEYESHTNMTMDTQFMSQSILFDIEDRDARERVAEVLAKMCTWYRHNYNPVFGCSWIFVDGAQEMSVMTNKEFGDVTENDADRVERYLGAVAPSWEPIGLNDKMLEDQIKVRKFCNRVDFEHGLPKYQLEVSEDCDIDYGKHKMILADTVKWPSYAKTKAFLGACRLHRVNLFCSAKSDEYCYGKVPDWVNINATSRIGVIDMLRPGAPAPQFPWIGITDYVKLDYRLPQFMYHVSRMSYNPRIQIIVVLHDIPSDIPQSMERDGRSSFHEKQFRGIAESIAHQNNRKPVLFSVSIPGVASMLQRAGAHVSPTVEDCMNDLTVVVGRYMELGEVTYERATVEVIEDNPKPILPYLSDIRRLLKA